jgi:hypothetical protein
MRHIGPIELTVKLCRSGSAGISILESTDAGEVFRWSAIAGEFSVQLGETIPRDGSPSGIAVARTTVLLFNEPDRFFPKLRYTRPRIYEALLTPWESDGRVVGTLWAIDHEPAERFNLEDVRILGSLAQFAAAGWRLKGVNLEFWG